MSSQVRARGRIVNSRRSRVWPGKVLACGVNIKNFIWHHRLPLSTIPSSPCPKSQRSQRSLSTVAEKWANLWKEVVELYHTSKVVRNIRIFTSIHPYHSPQYPQRSLSRLAAKSEILWNRQGIPGHSVSVIVAQFSSNRRHTSLRFHPHANYPRPPQNNRDPFPFISIRHRRNLRSQSIYVAKRLSSHPWHTLIAVYNTDELTFPTDRGRIITHGTHRLEQRDKTRSSKMLWSNNRFTLFGNSEPSTLFNTPSPASWTSRVPSNKTSSKHQPRAEPVTVQYQRRLPGTIGKRVVNRHTPITTLKELSPVKNLATFLSAEVEISPAQPACTETEIHINAFVRRQVSEFVTVQHNVRSGISAQSKPCKATGTYKTK